MPPSDAQREIWLSAQQGKDASRAFNEAMEIRFEQFMDAKGMHYALNRLQQRHQSLRAMFSESGDKLIVTEYIERIFPVCDLRGLAGIEVNSRLDSLRREEADTAFDLGKGPLWRAKVIFHDKESKLLITFHHIIADGWSLAVIFTELSAFYREFVNNEPVALPQAQQFSDYILHRDEQQKNGKYRRAADYWRNQFRRSVPVLHLPTDLNRPALRSYKGGREDVYVDPRLAAKIKVAASRQGSTLFSWLLAAYFVFLYRITRQNDLIVGIPAAGQSVSAMDYLVGHCVNMLPLHQILEPDMDFGDYLRNIRTDILDAYDNQEFTFSQLIGNIPIERDKSRIPLVANTFNIDQEAHELDFGDCLASYHSLPRSHENFEWFFNLVVGRKQMTIECSYNSDLFTPKTIRHRLSEYLHLLDQLSESPRQALNRVSLLSDKDKSLLEKVNHTAFEYPEHLCLTALFEQQCLKHGNRTAVICSDYQYNYAELNQRANKLAHFLLDKNIGEGSIVGLLLSRSSQMLSALLAIQKTGAAYLPLDPEYPSERIAYILEHAKVGILITESILVPHLPDLRLQRILLDSDWPEIDRYKARDLTLKPNPDAMAYLIYTSGSTGKPKGVRVSNRNVVNLLSSMQQTPGLTADDRLLAVTTLSFDIAVLELFLPIITGAMVVICSREIAADGHLLAEEIEKHKITLMQATPATWRNLLAAGWRGNQTIKALIGGEAMPVDLIQPLLGNTASLWNMYGPTETTVWSCCCEITDADSPVRIGGPIANTQVYLLDEDRNPVPVACEGELYIGGDGVSMGYLHQPELSDEKFIKDPFCENGNRTIYRTGDLCKLHSDGRLEYINRLDNQVKIRGYRIELGEIEKTLSAHPRIDQCVAMVHEVQAGDSRLTAYYSGLLNRIGLSELREWTGKSLPGFMVPQYFIGLDKFPQTPNGKIDRKALPLPQYGKRSGKTDKQLRSPTEKYIARAWQIAIGGKAPGRNDNFFDIGGHSLLAMKFISEVKKDYGVKITLRSLLSDTLEQIALQIKPQDKPDTVQTAGSHERKPDKASGIILPLVSRFIDSGRGKIFTQLHLPPENAGTTKAVLICNPIGHEYMRSHRALQQLSDKLAKKGFHVLRFDYFATGDSEGEDNDNTLDDWRADIGSAYRYLQDYSACQHPHILGLRMGATLAADLYQLEPDILVLWDPIICGKTYMESLKQMHRLTIRDLDRFRWTRNDSGKTGESELLGFSFGESLQQQIEALHITELSGPQCKAAYVLLTDHKQESANVIRDWCQILPVCDIEFMPDTCFWDQPEQTETALLPHEIEHKILQILMNGY